TMHRTLGLLAAVLALGAATAHAGPKEACDYSAQYDGVSCIVMLDGKVVAETYSGSGAADKAWGLASGTKSFSGVAAAAAVQDGLFKLDDKVASILTEWQADGRRDITIRQLLSLTSGIKTPEPLKQLRVSFAEAVAMPLEHPPGSHYAYGQVPFQIFAAMMERRLGGEKYLAYLERRYLNALGIKLTLREGLFAGDPSWGGGGIMTARDWAVFGEFVRQGGIWNGKQLVDAAALAENFKGSPVHGGYGLTWWLKAPKGATVPTSGTTINATDFYKGGTDALPVGEVWMAAGAGKQRLMIVPERRMVVVRQTSKMLMGERTKFSDVEFLRLLLAP
ncbi:MAG TPA: serine hydrolase, partial [Alphaproteobacteria bacterium]|nr:serine hydrolase [Alphaproteobacteria bacterium]